MAIEASFTIDQEDFPLSTVFGQLTDATIELDRIVPTSEAIIPYFWIYAKDTGKLTADLSDDIGINSLKVIDEVEEQMFVRIEWNFDHESVLTAITNTGVNLLSGIGDKEKWTFEIRADEQQEISDFQTYCREHNIHETMKHMIYSSSNQTLIASHLSSTRSR